jgi:hypothetical protein
MTLPTKEKTWQYSVNNSLTSPGGSQPWSAEKLYTIKESLTNFASNPWTVPLSCDSTAVAASDLWTDYATDIIWGANQSATRSWIVLQQDGISSGWQMLLDLAGAVSGANMYLYVSPSAGFTGGSTTSRPTATDEIAVLSNFTWGGGPVDYGGKIHVMQSTDGECTRIFHTMNYLATNYAQNVILIDKPKHPVTHWTTPWFIHWYSSASALHAGDESVISDAANMRAYIDSGLVSLAATLPNAVGSDIHDVFNFADEVSGEYPLYPMGLWCNTAGKRGPKGEIFDFWWGAAQNTMEVRQYPAAVTRLFEQFEHVVVPWNGDLLIIS